MIILSSKRIIILFSVIVSLLGILTLRIYDLAKNRSDIYASQKFNTYKLVVNKSRGKIYDRNLKPLVSADSRYKVAVLPSVESKAYLHSVLSEDEFEKISGNFSKGVPFVFEIEHFIEESDDVRVFLIKKRYGENSLAVHFIGYCNNTLSKGVIGIEKAYDALLSDKSASLSISYPIDAAGRSLPGAEPVVFDKSYNSKAGISLTLDSRIQRIAESAAARIKNSGSILIMDVENGEILAGVSVPQYDRSNIAQSIKLSDSALLNRNLCAYNIGSTYKIIVSAAALSKGIPTSFSHNCSGRYEIGETTFFCHKKEGHGILNMKSAFANSCNPYFVSLGSTVGKQRLLSMSAAFGIGKRIELCEGLSTAEGNLPTSDEIKSSGDLANLSFGQGSLMATPVHIAKIISIIANGGHNVEPALVKGTVDENGSILDQAKPSGSVRIINSDTAATIRDFMINTVNNGTGRLACPNALGAGGKTASAETGWNVGGTQIVQAWFSGFYPAKNPKYAIVVLCEAGNSGAASCGPVFKTICDSLYKNGFCS